MPHNNQLERTQPVQVVDTGSAHDNPPTLSEGIALCLSGGGYRAMLFHLGALWTRISDFAVVPYPPDHSSALISRGSDARNPTTKGDIVVIPVKLIAMAITGAIAGGLIAVILGRMRSQAAAWRIGVADRSGSVPCRIRG
jgi:hypothetical protein